MPPIAEEIYAFPQAWSAADFPDLNVLKQPLSSPQTAALVQCLDQVKAAGLELPAIEAAHFAHPDLDAAFAQLRQDLLYQRGITILQGDSRRRAGKESLAFQRFRSITRTTGEFD